MGYHTIEGRKRISEAMKGNQHACGSHVSPGPMPKERREQIRASKLAKSNKETWLYLDGKLQPQKDILKKLIERQGSVCAICGREETHCNQWGLCRLAIDHNHETREARGLLCSDCNTKLGHLENLEFIIKAKLYLERTSTDV